MLQLHNDTPFSATMFVLSDRAGVDTLVVPVQAVLTWETGRLRIADQQRPIPLVDECGEDSATASVRYPGEVRLAPPGTDIIILGEAHAPRARPTTTCDVAVHVGSIHHAARVVGDRTWEPGVAGLRASQPRPFTSMPLGHERAVGGREEPVNPIGRGLRSGRSNGALIGTPLPNVESIDAPLKSPDQRPPPVGFGAIPPAWLPRRTYAGTYDAAWRRTRAPYLPQDLDLRFFHAAAPGLASRAPLSGGELVELHLLSPRERDSFILPSCLASVEVRLADASYRPALQLVTVLLEPTSARVTLVWQAALACDGRPLYIDAVTVRAVATDAIGGL